MENKSLKKLKIITNCVVALLIVISNFGFAPAMQAVEIPTLTIGSPSALIGTTINVPINASAFSSFASNIGSVTLTIQFDNTLLTYINTTFNNLPIAAQASLIGANKIVINWADNTAVTPITIPDGSLVTLNFTVNSSATVSTNISFDISTVDTSQVMDSAFNLIDTNFVDGVISLNPAATLSSIAITTPANKLSYTVGDALDITGLVVTGTYSDASTQVETITIANVTGFNSSSAVIGQVLTITVGVQTTTYTIDVVAPLPTPDLTPPVITLIGDAVVNLTVGDTYNDAGATALDDKDGDITANIVKTGLPISTATPGAYTITYNVQDAAGNIATLVERTVIVSEVVNPPVPEPEPEPEPDTIPPVITLNGAFEITFTVGETYAELGATALDDVDGAIIVTITGSVDTAVIGDYTITYTATDVANNTAAATRIIHVVAPPPVPDTTPPVITLTGDAVVNLTVGDTYLDAGATAVDDVDGVVATHADGGVNTNIAGTYVITYNAIDVAGNVAAPVTRTVVVSEAVVPPVSEPEPDTTVPVITLLGADVVNLYVGDTYVDAGATALDDIDGNITANIISVNPINAAVPGTYTITYNVSDVAGNTATQVTRTVVVSIRASGGGGGGSGFVVLFSGVLANTGPTYPTPSAAVEAVKAVVNIVPVQAVLGEKVYNYDNGALLRGSDHKVYVVDNGKLQHISNLKELAKYAGQEILKVSDDTVASYSRVVVESKVLGVKVYDNGALLRGSDRKVYVVNNDKLQHLVNLEELAKYIGQDILKVNDDVITAYGQSR